jgi:hypothetical protein
MTKLMILSVVVACSGDPATPDAAPDARTNLDVAPGESCDASGTAFCAGYHGVCDPALICRLQCSAVDYPRCPAGEHEEHVDGGDHMQCLCVPD